MLDKVRAQNVNVIFVYVYSGIRFRHLRDPLIPKWHGDRNTVGFRCRGEMLLWPPLRQFEGKLQKPVNAFLREDALLYDNFTLRTGENPPANAGVLTFTVLAHHIEIDISRLPIGER